MESNNYLKKNEKLACKVLSHLKYSKVLAKFYKCKKNDFILQTAKILLHGEDPINFIIKVLNVNDEEIMEAGLEDLQK